MANIHLLQINLYNVYYQQLPFGRNRKAHIFAHKGHAIDLMGVVLIVWSRVECQHLIQCLQVFRWENGLKTFRNVHLKSCNRRAVYKTTTSAHMAIGVHDVRLDVENRCSIHQVGTKNMYHGPLVSFPFNSFQLHRR